ncbi:MAG: sensor histidine kinase [Lachnospiraceae bacterium]|nr:sensor histidine kinase [Lachnospiraceae bacterium]
MKFVMRYLREHFNIIGMELLFVCVFALIFYLYHLPIEAILYPAVICMLIGCIFGGYSILHAYEKHKKRVIMQDLHGNVMQELLEENAKIEEEDYQRIIVNLCQEMQLMEDKMTNSYQEMMDYFTVWVHQIKTPITSMRLHLGTEDSPLSQRLKSDLLRIEQYVEMVLTYLRMGADVTDYTFRTVHLDKVIKENIRKLRGDFIMKNLNLVYVPSDETVISDEKWLSFVIEQVLSNALKYTNEGSITISFEKPSTLCISDTGIGIAPEDIPRIFEKGYTGGNGRIDKRASGLGLYLCKEICNRLGHEISVTSEVEIGTTIKINLSQYRRVSEF